MRPFIDWESSTITFPYTVVVTVDDAVVVAVDFTVEVTVDAKDVVAELEAVDVSVVDAEVRRHFVLLLNSPAVKSSIKLFNADTVLLHSSRVAAPLLLVAYQFPYASHPTLSRMRFAGRGPVFSSTRVDNCSLTWLQPSSYMPKNDFFFTVVHSSG